MKKDVLVLVGLGTVPAISFLMGTEEGRVRRDDLLSRARKHSDEHAQRATGALPAPVERVGSRGYVSVVLRDAGGHHSCDAS